MPKTRLTTLVLLTIQLCLAQGFPATVEHKYGSTTLEVPPKRIVALGATDQDPLLALGEKPTAIRYWYGDYPHAIFPWAEDAADGATPEVLNMAELDFEKILSLEPDVIIAGYSGITEAEYENLSQIAPTLAQSGEYDDWATPWQVTTQNIGGILGKADEAEALVSDIEAQLDEAVEQHPEFSNVEIALYLPEYPYGERFLYGSNGQPTQFYTRLGFVSSPAIDEAVGTDGDSLSRERTELLDVDLLIVHGSGTAKGVVATAEALRDKLLEDPLIRQLDVVQEERVVYVPAPFSGAVGFNTVLSIPFALEAILPDLSEAVVRLEPPQTD